MRRIAQRGSRATCWYAPEVTLDADGSLTIPATSIWVGNVHYALPAYNGAVGTEPFRLFVVAAEAGGAAYLLAVTHDAVPAPLGGGAGAPCVAWRQVTGGDIQVLRSVTGD